MNPQIQAKSCPSCGQVSAVDAQFCARCGHAFATDFNQTQAIYTQPQSIVPADVNGKKIAAAICGILLGSLGIHKFILGYTSTGVIMLLVSLLSCGLAAPIMHVIGIVEGVLYLTKSDQQFQWEYLQNRKEWF